MKKNILLIFLIILYPTNLYSDNIAIGYVDLKYILKNSIPSKKLQNELDKGRDLFQKSINEEEIALRQAEKEINQKRDKIDEINLQFLIKDFESKVASIQRLVQKSRQQLETNFQLSQKLIADTVNDIVKELAINENLLLVFKTDNVIYADDNINYTSRVLEELNAKEDKFNFGTIYSEMIENIYQ
tara:strand:+ start:92 stop:649 length:558 start_codon:yes stop_codon:yes gene_type:complete